MIAPSSSRDSLSTVSSFYPTRKDSELILRKRKISQKTGFKGILDTDDPKIPDQASVFMAMMSDHNSSDLAPQRQMVSAENNTSGPAPFLNIQKTFDRSRLSLGLHGNDSCSHQSGLVSSSNDVVRLGINPMIQPEPEDLPKDNPKLEIAVLRWKSLLEIKACKQALVGDYEKKLLRDFYMNQTCDNWISICPVNGIDG
ncbi:hypothetical protein Tco_0390780 [Tanacetum coccineum]